MNEQDTIEAITKIMEPVDNAIRECQTGNEQVMLACGMMQRVKEILEHHLGDQAKTLLQEYVDGKHVS